MVTIAIMDVLVWQKTDALVALWVALVFVLTNVVKTVVEIALVLVMVAALHQQQLHLLALVQDSALAIAMEDAMVDVVLLVLVVPLLVKVDVAQDVAIIVLMHAAILVLEIHINNKKGIRYKNLIPFFYYFNSANSFSIVNSSLSIISKAQFSGTQFLNL